MYRVVGDLYAVRISNGLQKKRPDHAEIAQSEAESRGFYLGIFREAADTTGPLPEKRAFVQVASDCRNRLKFLSQNNNLAICAAVVLPVGFALQQTVRDLSIGVVIPMRFRA
jgi:hypothetical protein